MMATLTKTPIFKETRKIEEVTGVIVLGAVAALIGIYLLAPSNINNLDEERTFIFAIVCGLSWNPILDSAQSLVTNGRAGIQTGEIKQVTTQLESTAQKTPQEVAQKARDLIPKVSEALKTANELGESPRKREIKEASKEAIASLLNVAPKAPQAAVESLQAIAVEAANTKQIEIAVDGVQTLRSVGTQQPDTSLKFAVSQSLETIAAETKSATVKASAQVALDDVNSPHKGPTVVSPRVA